ncbi:MAG: hypothetical protein H6861_08455 [Rhodospirillales bacterium]|nr:hypothetical protein [Rhodospirillales bacterium]
MNKSDSEAEIFHRMNKLKPKAGLSAFSKSQGLISQKRIEKAQKAIDDKESLYHEEVEKILGNLQASWKDYCAQKSDNRTNALDRIYNYSNNVKDLTSMYNHTLMEYFAQSLRDFCEKIDVHKKEHQIIVQAHIDAMFVTLHEKLRSDESEKAKELMDAVAVAIEKYS